MPADPDATGALRESGALVEAPPTDGDATTSRIDAFLKGDGPDEPAKPDKPAKPAKPAKSPKPAATKADRADRADRRSARSRERREVTPKAAESTRRAPRMQARKVHRLVRHVEPWSVLKISLIFYFCIWVILLTSAVILWQVASSSGVIDNVESFIEEIFALDSFSFEAGQMFRAYAVGGLVMVVAATGFTVLLAVLFNLISDLTGGIRVTVVEEETAQFVEPDTEPKTALTPQVASRR